MSESTETTALSVRLPARLVRAVKVAAVAADTTMTAVVTEALVAELAKRKAEVARGK